MSKFNVGDTVKYIGLDHAEHSDFYPLYDTIGEIKEVCDDHCWVQWPKGSTSDDDYWSCEKINLELIETNKNEMIQNMNDMTNEEIWEMLRPKMEKNNVLSELGVLCQGEDKLNKLLDTSIIDGKYVTDVYPATAVQYAITIAYRSGYERAMKGRPFKFGEKKKKGGHWGPVDPNNLPKEGTRVRYAREDKEYKEIPLIALGDSGTFALGKVSLLPGIKFDDGRFWDWICFNGAEDCLDMWVEDDE